MKVLIMIMCGIFWPNKHVSYKTIYIYVYSISYMEYLYPSLYLTIHLSIFPFIYPPHTTHIHIYHIQNISSCIFIIIYTIYI